MLKKITIDFYWDEEWKQLYADSQKTHPVRTKFFSGEQMKQFNTQTSEKLNKSPTEERSVATIPNQGK